MGESLGMPYTGGKTCLRREPAQQPTQPACLLRTRKTYKAGRWRGIRRARTASGPVRSFRRRSE